MAGYDPFVELLDGTPIYSDGVAVTTEGVFPLAVGVVELTGSVQAAVQAVGNVRAGTIFLVVSPEAAVEAVGQITQVHTVDATVTAAASAAGVVTLVAADVFSGWGIPAGVP